MAEVQAGVAVAQAAAKEVTEIVAVPSKMEVVLKRAFANGETRLSGEGFAVGTAGHQLAAKAALGDKADDAAIEAAQAAAKLAYEEHVKPVMQRAAATVKADFERLGNASLTEAGTRAEQAALAKSVYDGAASVMERAAETAFPDGTDPKFVAAMVALRKKAGRAYMDGMKTELARVPELKSAFGGGVAGHAA